MSSKTERQKARSGESPARHSRNQYVEKILRENAERGTDRKAAKARARREREERFVEEFPEYQFDRAVGNTFNGLPLEEVADLAPANITYVVDHIDEHERILARYKTERGSQVTVTIVDFTRRDGL
ncbi:MAG: hypothetical protein ACD_50C00343G0014 [uncultured bacterium]|nr:MAG: hypothetical protein ACD_50C00343G0014 [uncultured bacterium]OGH13256.1 MAG: hypothetical protein A2687_03890 [Candidatus Levybacteria bacterium RIFCSPHIGHO2_01_FULL_38_26]